MAMTLGANNNSPVRELGRRVSPEKLETGEPFKSLFPVKSEDLDRLVVSMKRDGYKSSFPIVVWREQGVVIDGHTRLAAAIQAGLIEIVVQELSFESEDEALRFAKEAQLNRRNLSDAELLSLLPHYDSLEKRGVRQAGEEAKGKSSARTAEALGVNRGKIEKARTVAEKATPEQLEAINKGEKSLNKVFNEIKLEKSDEKPESTNIVDKSEAFELPAKTPEEPEVEKQLTPQASPTEPQTPETGRFINKDIYIEEDKRKQEIMISLRTPNGLLPIIAVGIKAFVNRTECDAFMNVNIELLRKAHENGRLGRKDNQTQT
jgi:ParB family chromosome partitioning protein